MIIRRNLAANFIGNAWNAILTLVATPVQLALLGVEAYGLISFITVLQVVVSALDFGLSSVVTKTLAGRRSTTEDSCENLIRTISTIYWGVAVIIAVGLLAATPTIVDSFFRSEFLSREIVVAAVQSIAIYLALRWPIAFYSGVISGLQHFHVLNAVRSGAISLRIIGGILLLLITPDLLLFLGWFVFVAALELVASIHFAYRGLPGVVGWPKFDFLALNSIWRFSALMYGIALLTILLTQLDRLFISNMLGLEALGYYSVAYNLGMGLSLVQTAINAVALPALSAAYASDDSHVLTLRYGKFCQLMSFMMIPLSFSVIFFSQPILELWVGVETALHSHRSLAILSAGFLMTSIYSNVYSLSVASGRLGVFFKANIIGLVLYVPMLMIGLSYVGYEGAAYAWLLLSAYYLFAVLPVVHRHLEMEHAIAWFRRQVLPFALIGFAAFAGGRLLSGIVGGPLGPVAGLSLALIAYGAMAVLALDKSIRNDLINAAQMVVGNRAR